MRSELDRLFDLRVHDSERPPDRAELLTGVTGCSGLLTMLTDRVDEELLTAAGADLRIVANYAVGYDNVDVDAATRRARSSMSATASSAVASVRTSGVFATRTPRRVAASTSTLS